MHEKVSSIASSAKEVPATKEWMQQYLRKQEPVVRGRVIRWWFHLTDPVETTKHAHSLQYESIRRGRLASMMLLFFLLLLLIFALPIGILSANLTIIVVTGLLLLVALVAILFNRRGKPYIVGLLLSSTFMLGLDTLILTSPGVLTVSSLFLFDLLIFSELFVASLLPANYVIVPALLNTIFIIATLTSMPKTPDLASAMHTLAYVILFRSLALHFVVSLLLWLWGHCATQTSKRVHQIEALAAQQHTLAVQEHMVAQQKRQQDASIEQIMQIHVQAANGDLGARVPLNEKMLLWPLSIALNNLLSRMQRLQQVEQEFLRLLPHLQSGNLAEHELQRVKDEVELLLLIIRDARQSQRCIRALRSGTLLDPLIQEISGQYLSALPPSSKNISTTLPSYSTTIVTNKSNGDNL